MLEVIRKKGQKEYSPDEVMIVQWKIQDFPKRGAGCQHLRGGKHTVLPIFPKKLNENEAILAEGTSHAR